MFYSNLNAILNRVIPKTDEKYVSVYILPKFVVLSRYFQVLRILKQFDIT